MKIQTFSIVAGTEACNARCPFCVSKMTVPNGVVLKPIPINFQRFEIACKLAEKWGATTAMLTGKGEPTLFPEQVQAYLGAMNGRFPIVELQTNGLWLAEDNPKVNHFLTEWKKCGLEMIAISVVHYTPEKNRQIYTPYKKDYIDLVALINKLHKFGYSVRISTILTRGYIDSIAEVKNMIDFCKRHKVEQLKFNPVTVPTVSRDDEAADWTRTHVLSEWGLEKIKEHLRAKGTKLMELLHGGVIYDYEGQNVCMYNCLTRDASKEDIRQLIFFPDGHIRYDWEYAGAIIL